MKPQIKRQNTSFHQAPLAAQKVLHLAEEGIKNLHGLLQVEFQSVLDCLHGVTGRVIVTGMGKSGHIARKCAATLSSTGTPAQFVHPAEASHGDLGMITQNDAVLALSFSGETPELADVIGYARRFKIPLIAITGHANSTLAQQADYVLVLPNCVEACPLGLAPTTSTTMMLVLTDMIAVSLLECKGFTSENFQVLHPGGKLGKNLLRVIDLMHQEHELPIVSKGTLVADALLLMTQKSFGCIGVMDDQCQKLIGIITDGDLRRHMQPSLLQKRVEDIMTASPKTIREKALAAEALGLMNELKITSLFIVNQNDYPVGIIHVHDCLRAGIM